jgi:hypothetical protein
VKKSASRNAQEMDLNDRFRSKERGLLPERAPKEEGVKSMLGFNAGLLEKLAKERTSLSSGEVLLIYRILQGNLEYLDRMVPTEIPIPT